MFSVHACNLFVAVTVDNQDTGFILGKLSLVFTIS